MGIRSFFGGMKRSNRAAWRMLLAAALALLAVALLLAAAGRRLPRPGAPSTTTSRSCTRPGPR